MLNWDQMTAFGVSVGAIWLAMKKWVNKIKPIIEPMIQDAEKRALDGLIDKEDRKQIVMTGIAAAEKAGVIKLNFITRLLISKIVDRIAGKLDDFITPVNNELPPAA